MRRMPHVNVGREYLVSTDTILNLLCVAVLIAFAVAVWLLTRDEKPAEEQRVAAARRRVGLAFNCRPCEEPVYDGPDSLRLLEDLEADMKAYGAAVADYYEPIPADYTTQENGDA